MQRIAAAMPENSRPRPWPMFGMLVIGLVAGAAIGGYAVSQRAQLNRLVLHARRMGDVMPPMDELDDEPVVTTHRANHRRKSTSEVSST